MDYDPMTQAPTPGPLSASDIAHVRDYWSAICDSDWHLIPANIRDDLEERFVAVGLAEWRSVTDDDLEDTFAYERGIEKGRSCLDLTALGHLAFKADADGWMPWSGGENPVPGQRVQWRTRNTESTMSVLSNNLDWTHECRRGFDPIIAFRLAPTAPVEASGSFEERAVMLTKKHGNPVGTDYEQGQNDMGYRMVTMAREADAVIAALRPQPSGETRDIGATSRLTKLIEDMENLKRAYHPSTFSDPVSSFWRDVEALSARPLALGGQHSGGEWRCPDCGAQADEWFDCCQNPARAEAQDEGAAGEPVALAECPPGLFLWNGTLGFKSEYGAMEPIGSNFKTWKVGSRADAYCADSGEYFWGGTSNHADRDKVLVMPIDAVSAHPSPTPAADPVSIVPPHCTGIALSFEPGVLHVSKDGSGYIAIDEKHFELEDDRCEGPDGPEGSIHWITRLDASEVVALRDFLTGATPAADADRVRAALTDLVTWFDKPVQGERGMVWVIRAGDQGADDAVAEALAALKTEGE